MTSLKLAKEKNQMPLNVCICGWYFLDDWYASLLRLAEKEVIRPFVVANQDHDLLDLSGISYAVRENTGLEWGAYNYYLNHVWEEGNTIFVHDDMDFQPVLQNNGKVVPGEDLFYRLSNLDIDHGYIFSSRLEDAINWGRHGRILFVSDKLMKWLLDEGGIWFDKDNSQNYNAGIINFDATMKDAEKEGFDVRNKIYFPGIMQGYRGEFKGRVIQ